MSPSAAVLSQFWMQSYCPAANHPRSPNCSVRFSRVVIACIRLQSLWEIAFFQRLEVGRWPSEGLGGTIGLVHVPNFLKPTTQVILLFTASNGLFYTH